MPRNYSHTEQIPKGLFAEGRTGLGVRDMLDDLDSKSHPHEVFGPAELQMTFQIKDWRDSRFYITH